MLLGGLYLSMTHEISTCYLQMHSRIDFIQTQERMCMYMCEREGRKERKWHSRERRRRRKVEALARTCGRRCIAQLSERCENRSMGFRTAETTDARHVDHVVAATLTNSTAFGRHLVRETKSEIEELKLYA